LGERLVLAGRAPLDDRPCPANQPGIVRSTVSMARVAYAALPEGHNGRKQREEPSPARAAGFPDRPPMPREAEHTLLTQALNQADGSQSASASLSVAASAEQTAAPLQTPWPHRKTGRTVCMEPVCGGRSPVSDPWGGATLVAPSTPVAPHKGLDSSRLLSPASVTVSSFVAGVKRGFTPPLSVNA
jgi:hypothetical protein